MSTSRLDPASWIAPSKALRIIFVRTALPRGSSTHLLSKPNARTRLLKRLLRDQVSHRAYYCSFFVNNPTPLYEPSFIDLSNEQHNNNDDYITIQPHYPDLLFTEPLHTVSLWFLQSALTILSSFIIPLLWWQSTSQVNRELHCACLCPSDATFHSISFVFCRTIIISFRDGFGVDVRPLGSWWRVLQEAGSIFTLLILLTSNLYHT